jgi:hypothetical protein
MTSKDAPFKSPKPYPSLWMGYGIGRSYSNLIIGFSKQDAWVYVQIDNKERPTWFSDLQRDQEEITAEFGQELIWEERLNLKHSRIQISQEVDMTNQNNWSSVFEWMLENMIRMKKTFKPRVKALSESVVNTEPNNNED